MAKKFDTFTVQFMLIPQKVLFGIGGIRIRTDWEVRICWLRAEMQQYSNWTNELHCRTPLVYYASWLRPSGTVSDIFGNYGVECTGDLVMSAIQAYLLVNSSMG